MAYKLCLFLLFCLPGFACQTGQTSVNIPQNDNKQTPQTGVSDEEIKILFVESGLGEGDGNLEKLMKLPKERVVAVVRKVKENGLARGETGFQTEHQSESLKVKSAYFLWKLGVDTAANEKFIVDATKNKDISLRFNAFTYLESIVWDGKKEYLPLIFKAAPEADGAYAMEMHGLFLNELEHSPKIFLLYLSKESLEIRKRVYKLMPAKSDVFDEETFQKILANVRKLEDDKEVKNIAGEFLRELDKRQ